MRRLPVTSRAYAAYWSAAAPLVLATLYLLLCLVARRHAEALAHELAVAARLSNYVRCA
jgi:hypothetical protein